MKHRVLVLAHGHPDFGGGGGELAAYQLYKALDGLPEVEAAWFLGATGTSSSGALRMRRPGEYIWDQRTTDMLTYRAENRRATSMAFRDLIKELRPTVVFTHHYHQLGLETLRVIRDTLPSVHIVMTLHELKAICAHDGQMVKTRSMSLCHSESPQECRQCFPEITAEAFWLRKRYMQKQFELVDHFVAPSAFLKSRYVEWGLEDAQITVIENGQETSCILPPRELRPGETRNRFAFFGQIHPFKGIDVLLEAIKLLPRADRKRILVEVHGNSLELQKEEFRNRIAELRGPLERDGVLRWVGPYTRAELPRRMAKIDWLLVPSIWWENSPMVIQEAFVYGRPVICSGLGGMAEKVRHGVDGWHADPKNPHDWAETLMRLVDEPAIWDRLYKGIRAPLTYKECAVQHMALVD